MDQILGDLPFCFLYVDYILIFSPDLGLTVHTSVSNISILGLGSASYIVICGGSALNSRF